MKDALWEAYFDVDQAVGVLMEEKSKQEAKEKKKAGESEVGLDLLRPCSASWNRTHPQVSWGPPTIFIHD